MYSETHTSGMKQFFIAVGAAAVFLAISLVIQFFTKSTPLIGDIVSVILFVVLGYIVYTHYTAVFEYRVDGHKLIITRKIGHREVSLTLKSGQINSITRSRPSGVRVSGKCVAVMFPKNPLYIVCSDSAVLIDGSEELYENIKNQMNGDKKWQE